MRKEKLAYRSGFVIKDEPGFVLNQKVDIVEERENTYLIRYFTTSPIIEIEKSKILLKN